MLALLLATAPASAARDERGSPGNALPTPKAAFSPDRVIVEWAPGADRGDRIDAREAAEVVSTSMLGAPEFQLVRLEDGQRMTAALAVLRDDPAVQVAARDGYSALNSLPNDPRLSELWGLHNLGSGIDGFAGAIAGDDINAPAAWDRTVGTPSTVIADIDSGYRFTDPDLGPVAWTNPDEIASNGQDDDGNGIVDDVHGADFVGPNADASILPVDGDPTDDNIDSGGHGLHTAGTMGAAGNNGVGITGVAQDVRIMPLRVCANSPSSSNEARCPSSAQVAAINYAGKEGARVANMSLGGTTVNLAVRDAIASNPQTLYVISAGNDGANNDSGASSPNGHHYPCDYNPLAEGKSAVDNIVCVAATNQADGLAGFSDWGAKSVDLGAPGTETLSTYPAIDQIFNDNFENPSSFATNWSATGANGGFTRTNGAPLTSFGMSASTGSSPVANNVVESTSAAIPIPNGYGSCTFVQTRTVSTDSNDFYEYFVLKDGSPVYSPGKISSSGTFHTPAIASLANSNVRLRFRFTTGTSPVAQRGVWLDDLKLSCYKPLSEPLTYEFLDGTSMAAPHVTGAAGLLFSLKPSATVTEVRNALLSSVDPVPALSGKTTTGGRLDVAAALNALPTSSQPSLEPVATPNPSATAKPSARCVVPKLAGKTLPRAKAALTAAHCKLGKVTMPRAKPGHRLPPLVVKSSTPSAGAKPASGKVDLKLAPKPKPKKRHH